MAAVSALGITAPIACPVAGQTAVITWSDSYSVWRTAVGLEPVGAQTRVKEPFWPNRASSWKKTSTRSPGRAAAITSTLPRAPF